MVRRADRSLSWPRLIGIASGTFGAALTVATLAQFAVANSLPTHTFATTSQQVVSFCGCVFFVLAFFLYTRREWARRALLVLTYCVLGALAIVLFLTLLPHSRTASASVHPGLRFLIGICALITVLTPGAFVLAVLHHADIRHAFRWENASNQVLEPTPDRRDNSPR
jgi:hypothetical protein